MTLKAQLTTEWVLQSNAPLGRWMENTVHRILPEITVFLGLPINHHLASLPLISPVILYHNYFCESLSLLWGSQTKPITYLVNSLQVWHFQFYRSAS